MPACQTLVPMGARAMRFRLVLSVSVHQAGRVPPVLKVCVFICHYNFVRDYRFEALRAGLLDVQSNLSEGLYGPGLQRSNPDD